MEDRHLTILREHWSDIRKLEPRNILPKLVRVLIETDYEEINQEQSSRRERCDKLLDILIRRGKNAFDVFVCALDKEAPHLALKLIEAEERTEHEPTQVRENSAKLRKEKHDLKTKLKAVKQSYKKTQQKREEGKTRDGKENDTKEIDITAVGLQKKETTTESLSEKEQDEREQKEIERDSARGENHPLRKKVKELKNIISEKSGDYQPKIQALQRDEGGERKERGNLQLLSRTLVAANEEQKQEVGQLQKKATRLERKVSQQISEVTCEKGKKKKKKKKKKRTTTQKVTCCSKEFEAADTESKIDFLPQVGTYQFDKDFDENGVVYALATKFGGTTSFIKATRSSDEIGDASDILRNQIIQSGFVSATKAEKRSWWCVDLTENYALQLTHYTLRHGNNTTHSYLINWELQGSLVGDKHSWKTLKTHKLDRGLRGVVPYQTCTWPIDENPEAFRFFRIFQTGNNSSVRRGIFLSGIELYGVLIKKK